MTHGARWSLGRESHDLARLVRILGASVNVEILRVLARERRKGDGWMYLSEIAAEIGESPGTVGVAIQKLLPFLEEKREKGLRYFRSRYVDVRLEADLPRSG